MNSLGKKKKQNLRACLAALRVQMMRQADTRPISPALSIDPYLIVECQIDRVSHEETRASSDDRAQRPQSDREK
jgi:hypothetical protein